MTTERGALHDERLQALRGAVHRRPEPSRAAADDDEVDVLMGRELEPDAQRPRHLAARRVAQGDATGQANERKLVRTERSDELGGRGIVGVLRIAPGVRQPVARGEVDDVPRRLR